MDIKAQRSVNVESTSEWIKHFCQDMLAVFEITPEQANATLDCNTTVYFTNKCNYQCPALIRNSNNLNTNEQTQYPLKYTVKSNHSEALSHVSD